MEDFRFRQFSLMQEEGVMKAGTDSVLLGSYLPPEKALHVLDIGTGSGLLALMMAQRSDAEITAVEIQEAACNLASRNFAASPWGSRISLVHDDIRHFAESTAERFDLVISNPPYFRNNRQYTSSTRETARAENWLPFAGLARAVSRLLTQEGRFWVILPVQESRELEKAAGESGLFIFDELLVSSYPHSRPIRRVTGFSKHEPVQVTRQQLHIYESQGQHSKEYISLTADFYTGLGRHFRSGE